MENIVTNELTRTLIILGIGIAGVSALFFRMMSTIRGSLNQYRKATFVYLLVSFIVFAAIASLSYYSVSKDQFIFYVIFELCFFLTGIGHVYYMRKFLNWSSNNEATGTELAFTVIAGLVGSMVFIMVYHYLNRNGFQYDMATSMIAFTIPWFVDQAFKRTIAIPLPIFKEWFYPINEVIKETDDDIFKNLLVISFEFQKNFTETHNTNFRSKAPVDMEMGKLFYYLINDYNDRHPTDCIEYTYESGEPHGWIFYKKPKWYTFITHYIHPDKTIFNNKIRENDIIICSRTIE